MSDAPAKRRPSVAPVALLLVLVTAAVFSEVRSQEFVAWDDDVNIYRNEHFAATSPDIAYFWRTPFFGMYIPVTYTVWGMLSAVAHQTPGPDRPPLNPHVFHTANLAFHLLNVLLVFAILRLLLGYRQGRGQPAAEPAGDGGGNPASRAGVPWPADAAQGAEPRQGLPSPVACGFSRRQARRSAAAEGRGAAPAVDPSPTPGALSSLPPSVFPAAVGALLFGLHPLQVEAVAWVTGMKDVLGGFFSLLALWAYLHFAASAAGGRPKRWAYAAGTAAYCLALLSKPSSAAVPLVAWLLDAFVLRRPRRKSALALAPWVLLAVPAAIATKLAQDPSAEVGFVVPLWARPLVAADALAFYLGKLALPLRLIPDYSRSPASILANGQAYFTWLAPALLTAGAWLLRKRHPWLLVSLGVFAVGLLPVLGFTRFVFQELSTVADRYVYLAMLAPALAVGGVLARFDTRWVKAASALALGLLAMLTLFQTLHWYGTRPLFEHTLTVNPRSTIAHNNLGAMDYLEGKFAEAAAHYQASLAVLPNDAPVHDNLAAALMALGKKEEAVQHWEEALRLDPTWARAHFNYGAYLAGEGMMNQAMAHWNEALRADPTFEPARKALERAGQLAGPGRKP